MATMDSVRGMSPLVQDRTRTRISAIRTSSNSLLRGPKAPKPRELEASHGGIGIVFFPAGSQERITLDDQDCSSSCHLIGGSSG